MRSALLVAPGRIEIEQVERPQVDDDTVIVKLAGIGVCGSNLHWWQGSTAATALWAFPIPGAGGHEYGGVVVEAGKRVRRVRVGDRVAIDQFHSTCCGTCAYCGAGIFSQCTNRHVFGPTGFTECLKLSERGLHVLPDNIETHVAAIVEPTATPVAALRRLGLRGGERVVVLGAGVMGLAAVGAAKALGAGKVVVTAKYDHQGKLATRFGADAVLPSGGEKVAERILAELGGGGADIVVETVGGHAPTLPLAAEVVRPRGTVVVLGLWDDPVAIDSWKGVLKEITYMFCLCYGQTGVKTDYEYSIELMASGRVPMQELVTHVLPLDRIGEAFELAGDKTKGVIKVVVTP
jgi:threonine dehydrogenase-like Zn-dependent dehydrogenase